MTTKDDSKHSTYEIIEETEATEKHTIAVILDNEFGALSRVISQFSSRGYNIESLTVSEVDHEKTLSRITVVTFATKSVIEQVIKLLERLIPVHSVHDLSVEGPHIERTLGLVKVVNSDNDARSKVQKIADDFGARTIDSTADSFIFELSDTSETLNQFIENLSEYGVKEIARTGVTAISRGSGYIED